MLTTQFEEEIAVLRLSHPERGNSFGVEEAGVLSQVLKKKGLRGIVLTGAGERFFCTGGNLAAQAAAKNAKAALAQQKKIREALRRLAECGIPAVALVNGDAFGGGLEVLSVFDHVITLPHSLFGFWQRKLGLSFGWGGGKRLAGRLGGQRLRHFALEASQFSASEALRAGLVDEISPPHLAMERAYDWITGVTKNPSYSALKTWSVETEFRVFDKLWMNERHKNTVKKHRR